MDINEYILKKARGASICEPWADKLTNVKSIDGFLKMYVKGIDFCLDNNFPSNEDLIRLGGTDLARYGIYVDSVKKLNDRSFIVLLGKSRAELSYSGYSASQLFVKHTTVANVKARDHSYLIIDCFDDSLIEVFAERNSRILINVYGKGAVKAAGSGSITIVNKHKNRY